MPLLITMHCVFTLLLLFIMTIQLCDGVVMIPLRHRYAIAARNKEHWSKLQEQSSVAIIGKASTAAAEASIEQYYEPPASSPFKILGKSITNLFRGSKDMVVNWGKARSLYRKRNREGMKSLSFTEFSFLEKMKSDRSITFRILCLLPFSPEFVFYGYLVTPLISSGNPWAWSALPSSFDCPADQRQRERIMNRRRMQTVMMTLHELKSIASDDPNVQNRKHRQEQVAVIDRALRKNSMDDALEELSCWFSSPDKRNKKKLQKLHLKKVPGKIVKQCCRSLGIEGVPNILLIRTWNIWELESQLDHVRNSDRYLQAKGLDSLNFNELRAACFERCIPEEGRNAAALKADLNDWMTLVSKPIVIDEKVNGAGGFLRKPKQVANFQNKRLAMMALYARKGLMTSNMSDTYKLALN